MALNHVTLDDKYDLDQEPHLRHRLPGAGAALPDAEGARPPRRPQHRRLRHRLSRLAARRPRPAVPCAPQRSLDKYDIRFQAGINEDLAATALWGTQQAELRGEGKFDGVFGMWYGKGPGVDRTGDVFRHANFAGTSKHGGVLALMGDDHTAESSTTAHQSEFHFVDVMIPILNPAGVQEILDYGLYGWAMSRFCGTWVGAQVHARDGRIDRRDRRQPRARQHRHPDRLRRCRKAGSTSACATPSSARRRGCTTTSATPCSRSCAPTSSTAYITSGGRKPKIGIITIGKSYLDVRQALDELGIDEVKCNDLGLRLYKIGCPWPISQRELAEFAAGPRAHHRGRGEALADRGAGARGALRHRQSAGLHRQEGRAGQLAVPGQGRARSQRRRDLHRRAHAAAYRPQRARSPARVARLKEAQRIARRDAGHRACACPISAPAARTTPRPWCRRACAPMPASAATTWRSGWTARRSATPRWAARAPTGSARRRSPSAPHVFQNLGDGTYNHSGYMAIRAAIASGVNITYKILFNDAVAMTGGQANDGGLTVPQIARQVAAEGAKRVVVVTDEPEKYPERDGLAARASPSITATSSIEVQTRARGDPRRHGADLRPDLRGREAPAPQARHVPRSRQARHHQRAGLRGLRRLRREVELRLGAAAGDRMGPQAHHRPVELQQGLFLRQGLLPVVRHRARRQAEEGHRRRRRSTTCRRCRSRRCRRSARPTTSSSPASAAPASSPSAASSAWRRISKARASASSTWPGSRRRAARSTATCASPSGRRTSTPSASRPAAPISCSAATSWSPATSKVLAAVKHGETDMVVNTAEFLPGDFTRNADFSLPTERLKRAILADAGPRARPISSTPRGSPPRCSATPIGANMFLVGYAYQLGALPLSAAAIEQAIELNGEAVRDEQGRLPLGPPRRGRSGRGRGADQAQRPRPRATRAGSRSRSTR